MVSSPLDVLQLAWRRKIWVIVATLIGLALGVAAVKLIPPTYRSSTQILVESPRVPSEYVRTTVTTSLQERLRTIEQQITSRENLERIILDMGLHSDLVGEGFMDQAVARARKALSIDVRGNRVFTIFFRASEPVVAADTANYIADLFIRENLRIRELQARSTSTFLQDELDEMQGQLEEQEAKIASFRLRSAGQLPDQRESNLSAIASLRTRIGINLEAIENVEMRRILLENELSASASSTAVESPRTRRQELGLELTRLESLYTERHPDVVRVKRELQALEEQAAASAAATPEATLQTDSEAQVRVDAVGLELGRLKGERERLLSDMDLFQQRLEMTPRVEQEMLILTRDYNNIVEAHQSLLSKRLEARLAENMEKQRQSEQFRILERARTPRKPDSPNVAIVLFLATAMGVLSGLGLAYVQEQTDETFHDPEVLAVAFPEIPLLATLPFVKPSVEQNSGNVEPIDGRQSAGDAG